jgi:hypothetical protein
MSKYIYNSSTSCRRQQKWIPVSGVHLGHGATITEPAHTGWELKARLTIMLCQKLHNYKNRIIGMSLNYYPSICLKKGDKLERT